MAEEFITIDLGEDGPLRFSTPQQIVEWVQAQQHDWEWITTRAPTMKGQVRDAATRYTQFFNALNDAVTQHRTDQSRGNLQNRIQSTFNNFVRNKVIAITRTKHGAVIQQLLADAGGPTSDSAARRAVAAIVHMGSAEDNVSVNVPYVRTATLAMIDYARTENGLQAQVSATQGAIAAANRELAQRQSDLDKAEADYRLKLQEWATVVADMVAANDTKATDIVARLEDVKTTFETQMGLQAPAQYWATKAASHTASAKTYRGLLIKWGSFFVFATIAAYVGVFWLVIVARFGSENELAAGVLFFGALAVWTTGALWAARLMSRLYMSEHHLGIDAAERATMATTYLALTNTRSADEKDRAVVLAALFRPTADGIVKDDPPPLLTPAAFLAGLVTPNR